MVPPYIRVTNSIDLIKNLEELSLTEISRRPKAIGIPMGLSGGGRLPEVLSSIA
jgi:hypothetical protein